ncbi:MAG: hypothetical protein WC209_05530 [Ignavibacteriaceae bacterium]|jgi:hypothetical protein
MKQPLAILIAALTVTTTFGQITTTKVASKVEQTDNTPYDSIKNFLGKEVYKYVGQELYLNGKAESLREYGYEGFSLDYTKSSLTDKSNVYKCCDSYNSKYDELAGKYFTVLEVIKHPKSAESEYLYSKKFYLKLQEKEKKDIVYYEYDSQYEYLFPFIDVGYFTKLKQTQIGKEYVVRGKNWLASGPMTDMKTGKHVENFEAGTKWKCVDITIEEKYFSLSLVLENEKSEQIPLSIDNANRTNWVFEATQAELYKKKFGGENWRKILDGKVKIGMTKEMCELSWGKPQSVNETITSGKKNEQWVYADNYLYFDNGVLTAIQ